MVDTVEIPLLDERQIARLASPAGRIGFDDRGNAVYEWRPSLSVDNQEAEQLRADALAHPGLAIVDDAPPANAPIQRNATGLRVGYNPYDSGQLDKKTRKPRDLRELSKWIELRKKMTDRND